MLFVVLFVVVICLFVDCYLLRIVGCCFLFAGCLVCVTACCLLCAVCCVLFVVVRCLQCVVCSLLNWCSVFAVGCFCSLSFVV